MWHRVRDFVANAAQHRMKRYETATSALAYDLDACLLQDVAHLGRELVVELHQIGAALVAVLELVVGEKFFHDSVCESPEHAFPVRDVLRRIPGGATMPRTCGTGVTLKPASLSVGTSGNAARRFSVTCASTRMLPARMLARLGRLDHHHVDVPAEKRGDARRRRREGDELPARAAHLLQLLAHDVVAARDRAPDCLSSPGFCLAALTKSASVL